MASESVAMAPLTMDAFDSASLLISEATALLEMTWRTSNDNEEDFDMIQSACRVTFRLLEEAQALLHKGDPS